MSVREKRPGYWEVRVYAGRDPITGKSRSVARGLRGTKREAKRLEACLLTDLSRHPVVDTEGTVAYTCTAVIDHLELIGRSPTTIDGYRQLADGRIRQHLGAITLRDLTARRLDQFYGTLVAEGVSPGRIEKYHRLLHLVLNRAVRWEWVGRNVAATASPPAVYRAPVEPPSVDAVQRVLEEARRSQNPDIGTALLLLAGLGCRRGELCGLQWGDIDLDTGAVTIQRAVVKPNGQPLIVKAPKNNRSRVVRVGPLVVEELVRYQVMVEKRLAVLGILLDPSSFVFSSEADGSVPWVPLRLTHAFVRFRKRVGVDCRLHDLRHWNVSVLLDQGEPITVASARAGHSHAATTGRIYAHRLPNGTDRAAEIIDRALYGDA